MAQAGIEVVGLDPDLLDDLRVRQERRPAPEPGIAELRVGRAVDSSGGIVPGAEIRVIQKSTGFVRNAVTNEKGNYEVPGLFPGTYRIEASLAGFKTAVVDDVPLQGAQRLEINVALEVGQISDSVVVTSRRNLLDVADVGVSTVFDEKK
ncbi:MAG: hypothetical protein DMG07_17360, partial [Acidobacteria bacterium]